MDEVAEKTRIYFDFEFCQLGTQTFHISVGLCDDEGDCFYGEFSDYPQEAVSAWVQENVLSKLWLKNPPPEMPPACQYVVGSGFEIAAILEGWLKERAASRQVEMWGDVNAYDWVLFCQMWGGMFDIPDTVYYIPFDLATLFKIKGIDPDYSREEFAEMSHHALDHKHNALYDAITIGACVRKALELPDLVHVN